MNRYIVLILIVAVALWYFNRSCSQGPSAVVSPSGALTSGEEGQGVSPSNRNSLQKKHPSVRPEFDKVCAEHGVIIVSWSEPAINVVDVEVKSRDFNAPNDILDDLIEMHILKDVINFSDGHKRFQVRDENGDFWWHVRHKLRAYKD